MDLRSAADLSDPHGDVLRLAKATSTTFVNLDHARDHTSDEDDRVRRELAELEVSPEVSTCIFGSWARNELTEESDYDWAVLVDHEFEAYEPAVVREMLAAVQHLGDDERQPGKQAVFGVPIAAVLSRLGLVTRATASCDSKRVLSRVQRATRLERARPPSQILDRYRNEGLKSFVRHASRQEH